MLSIRRSLQLDALASGGLGVLLALLSGLAEEHLGLPVALSVGVGTFLVVWAAVCAWAAGRDSAGVTREIAFANIGWVVASAVFVLASWVDLTALGEVFVVAQALAVAGFVVLQLDAARRVQGRPELGVSHGTM